MSADRKEKHIANIRALLQDYMVKNNLIYTIDDIAEEFANYDLNIWFDVKE